MAINELEGAFLPELCHLIMSWAETELRTACDGDGDGDGHGLRGQGAAPANTPAVRVPPSSVAASLAGPTAPPLPDLIALSSMVSVSVQHGRSPLLLGWRWAWLALLFLLVIPGLPLAVTTHGLNLPDAAAVGNMASNALSRGPYLQAGTTNGVVVRWRTLEPMDSCVQIGSAPGQWLWTVSSPVLTNEHQVAITVTNPAAREKWYYSVGSTNVTLAWGEEVFFVLTPTASRPVRIWALGDSGTATLGLPFPGMVRDAYRAYTGSRPTDVWLMLGDNVYSDGLDAEYQIALFDVFARELRHTVVWTTIGNHETYARDDDGVGFAYLRNFSPPIHGESGGVPSGTRHYYSFDYANIHFVALDSMTEDRSSNGPMCTWLRADLEASAQDWLIAFWHHPPYSRGTHDSDSEDELIEMRQNAVRILEEFDVDLVLCGHSHSYERSFLLHGHYGISTSLAPSMRKDSGSGRPLDTGAYRKGVPATGLPGGAVYIVAGSAGQTGGGRLDHPAMFASLNRLGSMVVDVDGSRLEAQMLSEAGQILDQFTMVKGGVPEPLRFVQFKFDQGRVTARWKSVAGQRYRVEQTAGFDPFNGDCAWSEVAEVSAIEATSTWSEAVPPGMTARFYRIVALP